MLFPWCPFQVRRLKESAVQNDQGNSKFAQGDYGGAVMFYNQALTKVKDQAPLYCNRAHAHLKLGNYSLAREDCDAALRVKPVCSRCACRFAVRDVEQSRTCQSSRQRTIPRANPHSLNDRVMSRLSFAALLLTKQKEMLRRLSWTLKMRWHLGRSSR